MIVDAFLNLIRNAIHGDGFVYPTHIGIGTGTTAPAANNTALETEVYPYGGSRGIISSKTIITSKEVVFQLSLLPAQGNGNDLTEVAIFNSATGGTMTNRIVHTEITKTSSFELVYQITIAVSDV
jgi:hypothetical protein